MHPETPTLQGRHIRLEPLALHHADALVAAATGDPILYRWSPVPQTKPAATAYIETALAWRDAGTAVSFAVVLAENARTENGHADSNQVIGSTRFFNLERWAWPETHPEHNRRPVDACEIGYTWYSPTAIRTAANTEAKLLLLNHAFETWRALRVCLHTDVRNTRSRAAIERIRRQTGRYPPFPTSRRRPNPPRLSPLFHPSRRLAGSRAAADGTSRTPLTPPANYFSNGGCPSGGAAP